MAMAPMTLPSAATGTGVSPISSRAVSHSSLSGGRMILCCSSSLLFPTRILFPSTWPLMPPPANTWMPSAAGRGKLEALRRMALPIWCSEPFSTAAARRRTSSSSPNRALIAVTSVFPVVRVPVLSKAIRVTLPAFSRNSPPLTRTPDLAALPMPATMEIGVEMTRAPGQPMTNKVRAVWRLRVKRPVRAARAIIAGVYQRENFSINFCVGALRSWASSTM